jgi:ectoine hydroxylase-related dioxygenase (phytanoyl-CoA dioxygenase family)
LDRWLDVRGGIGDRNEVQAARHLIGSWPDAMTVWRRSALLDVVGQTLGEGAGLVRALYFDKPPQRAWSLPWHRDQTIAVRRHCTPLAPFSKPTVKDGVAHVEAPHELLERMVTLRIHLDDMTAANGPLLALPGSHSEPSRSSATASPPRRVLASAGDVVVMRPLLFHASQMSDTDCVDRRRVVHLEFAAEESLASGFEWHTFLTLT